MSGATSHQPAIMGQRAGTRGIPRWPERAQPWIQPRELHNTRLALRAQYRTAGATTPSGDANGARICIRVPGVSSNASTKLGEYVMRRMIGIVAATGLGIGLLFATAGLAGAQTMIGGPQYFEDGVAQPTETAVTAAEPTAAPANAAQPTTTRITTLQVTSTGVQPTATAANAVQPAAAGTMTVQFTGTGMNIVQPAAAPTSTAQPAATPASAAQPTTVLNVYPNILGPNLFGGRATQLNSTAR